MSMEFLQRFKLYVISFLLFLLLAFFPMRALGDDHILPEKDELQSVIRDLRGSGYRCFANALQMVEIQSLFSSRRSYTFFAPPDEALYALVLASTSPQEYMDAIKYHIVNVKLSYYSLSHLPNVTLLDTLLQNRSLRLTTFAPGEEDENDALLMVDNVSVSFPDLYYVNRFAAHGLSAVLNPTAVDVLSLREIWKPSWKPVQEVFGDIFGQLESFPACSYPFQETCATPPEDIEKICRETSMHENSPTAPVLPAPGPSPCGEVGANGSMNVDEAISSKKVDEVIRSATSISTGHLSISIGEHYSSAGYSGDHKYHPHDDDRHHSHPRHSDSSPIIITITTTNKNIHAFTFSLTLILILILILAAILISVLCMPKILRLICLTTLTSLTTHPSEDFQFAH